LIREAINAVDALARRATVPFIFEQGKRAESVGTGTLFEVNGQNLIVTAGHVANNFKRYELGIPSGKDRRDIWSPGEGLVTEVIEHDVAVFRLDNSQSIMQLKAGWEFLTPSNVSLDAPDRNVAFFLHGYPQATSPKVGGEIRAVPVSLVMGLYNGPLDGFRENAPYDQSADLLLVHRAQGFEPGVGQSQVPKLDGMSGSSIWAVDLPRGGSEGRIWTPRESAKIIAVMISTYDNHWIRSKRWWVINPILDKITKGTI